jgi:hypothetical protein
MYIFEFWFGMCIKFISPVILIWLLCNNLMGDLASPYGDTDKMMQMYASMPIIASFMIIFGPMFSCYWPERFSHDINKEFEAD